jgi:small subunit ribosomal protein S3
MGQKVHPYGMRLGIIRPWLSRWYAEDARYREQLIEDVSLRRLLRERLSNAAVSQIVIERTADAVTVVVNTAKPGVVIGRSGSGVDRLNREIHRLIGRKVHLTVEEVKRPELDAQLVADNIASQISRRISFRRAVRQAIQRTMKSGAEGCKVKVSGRLGGSDIAHSETSRSPTGRVPLHTFRADVDYGLAEAKTTHGNIGVKVWIYKGEIIPDRKRQRFEEAREMAETPGVPSRRPAGEEAPATEAAEAPAEQPEPAAAPEAAEAPAEQPEPAAAPEAVAEDAPPPAEPAPEAVPADAAPAEPEAQVEATQETPEPAPEPPAETSPGDKTDVDA